MNVKILVKDVGSKEWRPVSEAESGQESELRKLLVESPSLIPLNEIKEGAPSLAFALDEFSLPGSGYIDVLAFSTQGDIAIIECKLAKNPESKREVIGQVFEYAAYLWGMGYEELDKQVKERKDDKTLAELVRENSDEEWDEDQFRNGIEQTLKEGSFFLIILVDEVNDTLKRIITYLNESMKSAFTLCALEMKRFRTERQEMIFPHLYGISTKPSISIRKKWDAKSFFEQVRTNKPEIFELFEKIYEWSQNTGKVEWGSGPQRGSFIFKYNKDGNDFSVFTVYADGELRINYEHMQGKVPTDVLEKFHKMIAEIPTVSYLRTDFKGFSTAKVEALTEPENLEKFKNAVLWLKSQIIEQQKSD